MALRIDLKPHERLIIGDVSIRNGGRRASLTFETKAKFLREKDILTESQARTACEKLYVILQAIYLTDKDILIENEFVQHANEIMTSVPSMGLYIADIHKKIEDGDYYLALKAGQDLITYEKYLTNLVE
ncbi:MULTISPECIES: flagellar biosynthesis repressor FlbT [Methylobacterium]|jgi:flagellar protein FlbT|uniref:flagellar biosynthesis repressor FlbT n=1 Tax=Methylobacterium TaxID=407 RepID=UPI0008E1DA9E|nr:MULTISPECIES: flagellar biosynthesis repressor FlbT [Methylobacterium]MBK3397359.1 flagellar biosynthesis repressor FlbT [Methylobacterium ajmalii]MBK3412590.1 flagellar biosynthesis repressor FlbT [Methylobacterium ajmalii]MBK3421600.1 flagellar biosynthesis repressor FlbT [Methylobacterium ajmalii]MBZ6415083.1 flagellar biosynthesis repressor FlbT [Methylobacterium sp.]SFF31914.1 flagellar protein FlbT [Methylobacterium sp. yr596]